MYRVAGAFPLGADGFTAGGSFLQGGLFVLFSAGGDGGVGASGALGVSDSIGVSCPLGLGSSISISAAYGEEAGGFVYISHSLTDGLFGSGTFAGSMSVSGSCRLPFEMSDGSSGLLRLTNSLDETGLWGGLTIASGLSAHSMAGGLTLKLSVDTDSLVVREDLSFLLDGRDASNGLLSAEINFYGKGIYADFTATVSGDGAGAATAEFIIHGAHYFFLIEERSTGKNTAELWGRAVQALDDAPYKGAADVFAVNAKASELAAGASWQAADFDVPLIAGAYSRFDLLKMLADEAGAELRICADGGVRIVDPYTGAEAVIPQAILELTEIEEAAQNSGVRVVSGLGSEPVIETAGRFEAASFGEVYVYTDSSTSVSADTDILKRTDRKIVRTNEQVRFSEGSASVSYPVFRLISGADAAWGRRLYRADTKPEILTVVYETVRETYMLYEDEVREAVLTANAVKTAFTAGSASSVREYAQKLTEDGEAAKRRAAAMHKKYGGGRFIELSHLFCLEAASGGPVTLQTPKGRGLVVESKVSISSAPLKIIHRTKIYCPKENNHG